MQAMLNIAIQAAISAGKLICQHVDRLDQVKVKSKGRNDFVTEVDMVAEREIIYHIQKAHPDHAILAEESGQTDGNEYCWIIDPIDGTMNFMHGFPQFAVSIAVQHKNKIVAGVVYDPLSQELFTAIRGAGARLNNRRIRVSKITKLQDALVSTGFSNRNKDGLQTHMERVSNVFTQASGLRRSGSAALDLAFVAAGRLDAYWEAGLQPWDVAAGTLLVQEAGGIVTDFSGEHEPVYSKQCLAGAPRIHEALLKIL